MKTTTTKTNQTTDRYLPILGCPVRRPAVTPGAATREELAWLLSECVAWMDAEHRETDLSKSIVRSCRAALARVGGAL